MSSFEMSQHHNSVSLYVCFEPHFVGSLFALCVCAHNKNGAFHFFESSFFCKKFDDVVQQRNCSSVLHEVSLMLI